MNTATVAYTTQEQATAELERQGVDVQWLTCTANYGDGNKAYTPGNTPTSGRETVADVDCQGESKDGREITVRGKVTQAVDGKCVRGSLTARVAGKEWFHVGVLGDCNAPDSETPTPPATWEPDEPDQPDEPGATVTVTETVWCKDDPKCWPANGK
ncbi:hypothetical protein ACFV6E_15985 [Streptomyces sp. NPDC059785]